MWYYPTITRNGEKFFVVSPAWGKYELSPTKHGYLWETEESCRSDNRWHHLIQPGDEVKYVRTYQA